MWRYSLFLLFALPALAIALNHDVISAVMIIVWAMLIIPVCIAQCIDYLRKPTSSPHVSPFKLLLQGLVGLFGSLSMLMGVSLVVWCLYNVFVKRLPEYSGPGGALELYLEGFGIGPALFSFGAYLFRLALRRGVTNNELIEPWRKDSDW